MMRKYLECRQLGNGNCSVAISGTEEEVLDLAVIHGIIAHGYDDPFKLRREVRAQLKDVPETKGALA